MKTSHLAPKPNNSKTQHNSKWLRRYHLAGWFLLFACLLGTTLVAQADNARTNNSTVITVQDDVRLANVKRLGINLGGHDQFGAATYLKNLISNPGFESAEYNMVFNLESHENGTTFVADFWDTAFNNDALNIGQPVDFWNGAEFYFLTGPAATAERKGIIDDFTHDNNRYTFITDDLGVWPDQIARDAMAVRKTLSGFEGDVNPLRVADTTTTRPDSPGSQSLKLATTGDFSPSYAEYFDSYGRDADTSAGKLYLVDGEWHFEIWAKAQTENDTLIVRFRRIGGNTFMSQSYSLTTEWQKLEHTFTVADGADQPIMSGTSNALAFELILGTESDTVWVDDVILEEDNQNPTAFNDRLVTRLQNLQPGVLRDWGDQLGSSLDNQLAVPHARKHTGYSPKFRIGDNYHYSLHEFLVLSQLLESEPWYVIPTGFTPEEMQNLAAYLAAPVGAHPYADLRASLGQAEPWTSVFSTIHLEFGNEIWGANENSDPFIGATVRGGERAGFLASLRFDQLKDSPYFDASDYNLTIGGQTFFPDRQREIEQNSTEHDAIGLAPYFGSLDNYQTPEEMFLPLYAHAHETVAAGSQVRQSEALIDAEMQGTEIDIYEINFRAVFGDAPAETRNEFLTSLAGGMSLPLTMLSYQNEMGIHNLAAYQAVQFSTKVGDDYLRSFGLLRDLNATGFKRPTWLGLEIANKAIQGDLITTLQTGAPTFQDGGNDIPYVQSYAYRDGGNYGLILFNLHLSDSQTVEIVMPSTPNAAGTQHLLSADSPLADNESAENVVITTTPLTDLAQNDTFDIPPHSMLVLQWTDSTITPTTIQLSDAAVQPVGLLPALLLAVVFALGYFTCRHLWHR